MQGSEIDDNINLGELFVVGIPGPDLDPPTLEMLTSVKPGGVCLFARNIREAAQVRSLLDQLREILGRDTILTLDQEGGRVDRLRRILEPMPSASQLHDVQSVRRHAELTARALRLLGFNMNYAPVLDVDGPGRDCSSNGLATRNFPGGAESVAAFGSAYLTTLEAGGVRGCVKHFPGLGASTIDSHELLPQVEISEAEFTSCDLAPYRAILSDGGPSAVMVAHAVYPKLSIQGDQPELPSSLNGRIVKGLLRERLGFEGVVVTDDLEMGAIMNTYGIGDASLLALGAGCDQLLICNDPGNIREAHARVSRAWDSGEIEPARVNESLKRVRCLKSSLADPMAFEPNEVAHLSKQIIEFKETLEKVNSQ